MADEILKHPRAELRAAARSIEGMGNAKSLEEFETEWREFFSCIEKVWNKVQRSCQSVRNRFNASGSRMDIGSKRHWFNDKSAYFL